MELSTKNIDKCIRTIERVASGKKYTIHTKCNFCTKKIRKNNLIARVNGLGGFNYYHPDCLLSKYK